MEIEENKLRDIINSLIYALETSTKDATIRKLVMSEFLHSLNRKNYIPTRDFEKWRLYASAKLEEVI